MRHIVVAVSLLSLCTAGTVDAYHASAKDGDAAARPSKISYIFAHGPVPRNRDIKLGLNIHTEDPTIASNNGDFTEGLQAKMVEYETYVDNVGGAVIQVAFGNITCNVNTLPVKNCIPPPHSTLTGAVNQYIVLVNPDGACGNCSKMPPVTYDKSGGQRHYVGMGDFFTYLHPSLPRSAAALSHSWTTRLPITLFPNKIEHIYLASHLQSSSKGWSVISHLNQQLSGSLPAAQWNKLYPKSPVSGGDPVTVTGSITIDSTLDVLQPDGVTVEPTKATRKTVGKLCGTCSGWPWPLDGVEHLHLYYSQGNQEIFLTDVKAHLQIQTGGGN